MTRMIAVLAAAALVACENAPLPTTVIITNTQNQGSQNNTGAGTASPCDALVAGVALEVTGGVFSGGKGKVGEPLHHRVNVALVNGGQLPPQCTASAPNASAAGACTSILGVPSLADVATVPSAAGVCTVTVGAFGRQASSSLEVIP